MGTNECSQPASKSSWDSQDFGDIKMVLKLARFRKSTGPRWVKSYELISHSSSYLSQKVSIPKCHGVTVDRNVITYKPENAAIIRSMHDYWCPGLLRRRCINNLTTEDIQVLVLNGDEVLLPNPY